MRSIEVGCAKPALRELCLQDNPLAATEALAAAKALADALLVGGDDGCGR